MIDDQTLKLRLTDEKRFRPCHYRRRIIRASLSYNEVGLENPLNKLDVKLVAVLRVAARNAAIDRDISRFNADKRRRNAWLRVNYCYS